MPLKQRVQAFDAIKLTYTKFYDLINPCQSSTIGAGKHLSKTTQTIAAVSLSHIAKLRSHSDHKFAIFMIRRASIFFSHCSRSCSAKVHSFHSLCGQSCFHSHPRQPTSGSDWLLHTNLPSTIARALSTSCFFLQKAQHTQQTVVSASKTSIVEFGLQRWVVPQLQCKSGAKLQCKNKHFRICTLARGKQTWRRHGDNVIVYVEMKKNN